MYPREPSQINTSFNYFTIEIPCSNFPDTNSRSYSTVSQMCFFNIISFRMQLKNFLYFYVDFYRNLLPLIEIKLIKLLHQVVIRYIMTNYVYIIALYPFNCNYYKIDMFFSISNNTLRFLKFLKNKYINKLTNLLTLWAIGRDAISLLLSKYKKLYMVRILFEIFVLRCRCKLLLK